MKHDYILMRISWIDAETYGDSSWISLEDGIEKAETPPPTMHSVGWVLYKNNDYVALTSDIGDEECGHITKIPISMITDTETFE